MESLYFGENTVRSQDRKSRISNSPRLSRLKPTFQIQTLEDRRLLSATISVSESLMVFNAVKNSSPSPTETLTIANTGDANLSLTGLNIVDDSNHTAGGSARFAMLNAGSAPATLAPGATFGLQLDYSAIATGIDWAVLDVSSSDQNTPVAQVALHGIGTAGLGGGNQPSLMNILQAYNQPNYANVGETNPNSAYYPEPPASNSDEVVLQELTKAGPGPVTIDVLASFTASATKPYTLGWYNVSDPQISQQQLFFTPTSESQSVYVQPQGLTSFDPGSTVFGFYNPSATVKVNNALVTGYTQDAFNTWDTTDPRKFRFFPAENPNGSTIPNTYIMTSTEWYSPAGYDFTNIVAIVSNVMPAANAPTGPVLTISNPVALPDSNTLIFNRIQFPNTSVGDTVHDTNTITLENTGEGSLVINNVAVAATTGSNGGTQYQLVNPPTFPITLGAGQSQAITVQFVLSQPNANGHSINETNSAGNGGGGSDYPGTLTITSNDTIAPTTVIPMAGWWQEHSESENEPALMEIVNQMIGYGTDINPSFINFLTQSTSPTAPPIYYGEEVVSPYWAEADSSQPVQVQQIDSFHTQGDTSGLKWYTQGSSSTNSILSTGSDVGQTFFPLNSAGTAPATGSFTTTTTFGFEVLNPNEYSDDAKNVGDDASGHEMRFYPVRNSSGVLIPNTYLLCADYPNGTAQNFDFQDNVYLISNIRPAVTETVVAPQTTGGAASPAGISAQDTSAGVSLQWVPVLDSTLTGYNIYSSLSATTGYNLVTTASPTACSFVDGSALPGQTLYYRIAAVNSTGIGLGVQTSVVTTGTPTTNLQSIAIGETPTGSTTTVTPNQSYTIVAGGPGVTSTVDGFRYVFAAETGNFDVAVQVNSLSVAGNFSTAGIMARDSLSDDGANVYMSASPVNFRFKYRTTDGGTENVAAGTTALTYPDVWVRLTRVGNVFSGYSSTDGIVWTLMGQETVSALQTTCYLGLAVAANTTASTTTAQLTGYGTTTLYSGPYPKPATYNVVSNQSVQEPLLSGAIDPTGTIVASSLIITSPPSEGGTASYDPTTGLLSYQSAAGFVGTETLTYTVADTNNQVSAPILVTFNVTASVPVAVNDTFTAIAGESTQLNVLANDTDAVSTLNPATLVIVSPPTSGASVSVDPTTGLITYLAPSTFSGTDTFTYDVSDYAGQLSTVATVTVNVGTTKITTKPVTVTAMVDQTTSFKILTGATDSSGTIQPSTVAITSTGAEGATVLVNSDGSIAYTPAPNFVGPDTFTYTVMDNKGHTSIPQTVTVDVGLTVGTAAINPHSLSFTSAGGPAVTMSINHGTMVIYLSNAATLSVVKSRAIISGVAEQINSMVVSDTVYGSVLTVATKGAGMVSIGGFSDTSSLKAIVAPHAILTGTISLRGITTLQVAQISSAKITVGTGLVNGFSLLAPAVADTTITSGVPIRLIKVNAWNGSALGASAITAPLIGTILDPGIFQASLTLTGSGTDLAAAQIKGQLSNANWKISGNVGSLVVGGLTATISASHIRGIRVVGNVNPGSAVTLSGTGLSLGAFSIGGSVDGTTITTAGNVGSIVGALFADDTVLIGAVAGTTITSVSTANVGTATLGTLRLTAGGMLGFSNSTLIAHTLGNTTLGIVDTTNASPAPDGVAMITARSITGTENGTVFRFLPSSVSPDAFGQFEIVRV